MPFAIQVAQFQLVTLAQFKLVTNRGGRLAAHTRLALRSRASRASRRLRTPRRSLARVIPFTPYRRHSQSTVQPSRNQRPRMRRSMRPCSLPNGTIPRRPGETSSGVSMRTRKATRNRKARSMVLHGWASGLNDKRPSHMDVQGEDTASWCPPPVSCGLAPRACL